MDRESQAFARVHVAAVWMCSIKENWRLVNTSDFIFNRVVSGSMGMEIGKTLCSSENTFLQKTCAFGQDHQIWWKVIWVSQP